MADLDQFTTPVEFRITGGMKTIDENREVMKVCYAFNQAIDKEGQMTGIVRGGTITVRVKALNNGNVHLVEWMLTSNMHKDGEIVFVETKDRRPMRTVEFKEAYCVDYRDVWEDKTGSADDLGHYEEFTLSCREITVKSTGSNPGVAKFSNNWK